MLFVLFWFGDDVTNTQRLIAIVQMSLRILNANNLTFIEIFVLWKFMLISVDSLCTNFFLKFEIKKTVVMLSICFNSYDKSTKEIVAFLPRYDLTWLPNCFLGIFFACESLPCLLQLFLFTGGLWKQ